MKIPIRYLLSIFSLAFLAAPLNLRAANAPAPVPAPAPVQPLQPQEKPGAWVAPLLPSETMFAVEIPDVKELIEKSRQTGLYQIFSNPDVQKAFKGPLMQAKFGLAMVEAQLGLKLKDMLGMLSQGEVTLALLGFDQAGADGKPIPELLIAVQAREKAGALLEELDRRVDQLQQQAGGVLDISQLPVGDVTVKSVRVPAQPISIHYALVDGTIVAAFGEGHIEKLLAMRQRAKAGAKPAADAKPETLAEVPCFARTLEKAGDKKDVLLYLNIVELFKNEILNLKPAVLDGPAAQAWNALGLDAVNSVAYALKIEDKGLRETAYIDAPAAARKGLLALLDGEELGSSALDVAPRNSIAAVALKFTPEKALEKLLGIAELADPAARAEIEKQIAAQGQALGLDLKKEAFAALNGQSVLSVSMQPHQPKLGIAFPQMVLDIGIKDAAAAENLVKSLREAGKERFEYADTILPGCVIGTVRERFPAGRKPFQFSYCIDQNDLLVALYPLALREELARRASLPLTAGGSRAQSIQAQANGLSGDDGFKSASAHLKGKSCVLLFADTEAIATALYDSLIPIAQLEPRNGKIDVNVLPSSGALLHGLTGTVFGLSADADGIVAEGYSPAGVVSFMSVLVPAAIIDARRKRRLRRKEEAAARGAGQQQEAVEPPKPPEGNF